MWLCALGALGLQVGLLEKFHGQLAALPKKAKH